MAKLDAILGALGDLSTNELWGKIKYDGNFRLNKKAAYNALRKSANKGGNTVRILPYSTFGIEEELPNTATDEDRARVAREAKPKIFQPFLYDASAEKWNLQLFNDYYFPVLREYIAVAKSLNMKVLFELYDNCSFWPTVQHLNPWRVNMQGLYDFYGAGDIGKVYVAKVIDELGDSVEYLLGNELTHEGVANDAQEVLFSKGKKPWGCGADLDIPSETAQTSVMKKECSKAEDLWGEDFKVQLFRTCHSSFDQNSPRMTQPVYWWAYHSILFSTDGMFPRPSGSQMYDAVKYVLDRLPVDVPQYGQGGKIRLAFENCCDTIDWDYEASLIEAIVSAAETYGLTFENKGKYPNDYGVNVNIQAIDENNNQLVLPVILSTGEEVISPCLVTLPEENKITAMATAIKDDGAAANLTLSFWPTEGLQVTFKFKLHQCSCFNWLTTWNFSKFFKCIFGGEKRCK